MAPSVKHRIASPNYAKQLINAIIFIRQQKQIPNFERISRCLQRTSDITLPAIKEHLDNAVIDGLIVEYTALGVKGQRSGLEQAGYRLPHLGEIEIEDNGHDWYCFECHCPGNVYECSDCFRVYHKDCTRENTNREIFTCTLCKAIRRNSRIQRKMLNKLLSYTILNLQEKEMLGGNMFCGILKAKELCKVGQKISTDDFGQFAYRNMDLNQMEQKVQASSYRCMEEFYADAQIILHNCTLVFGEENKYLIDLALMMVRDCKYELEEIELCPNCYHMSNAKPEDWFSQPCNPRHELVYAKQKGYNYWPAKVIKVLDGQYDVRFFGGLHQRAMIPAGCIRPINTDLNILAIKKSVGFQKAMTELKRYQEVSEKEQKAANNEKDKSEKEDEMKKNKENNGACEEMENNEEAMYFEHENVIGQNVCTIPKSKTRDRLQGQSRKAVKRKKESRKDIELVDDIGREQVTSTSVDKSANKKLKTLSKNSYRDEACSVTSSAEKVTNRCHVLTVSTAIQTSAVQTGTVSTQTDAAKEDLSVPGTSQASFESQKMLYEKMWHERVSETVAVLTRKLKEEFEEGKKLALKKLSQQLEEDFEKDKQMAVERTKASVNLEIDKARRAGEDKAKEQYMQEMKKLAAKHKETISQVKKMQWCQFCEKEAMYHCCWNTSYCSVRCQQVHWHKEHGRVCRRKQT